jgi:hypothetical protein
MEEKLKFELDSINQNDIITSICYFCNKFQDDVNGGKLKYCSKCFLNQKSFFEKLMRLKRKPIPSYDKILDNLYLGNFGSALCIEELKIIGVGKILCCALAMPMPFPDEILYKHLPIIDDSEEIIFPYLIEGIKFLKDCDQNVLIHCQAGVSRSASIVIGYIMWKMRLSFENALLFVKDKRKCICPNEGFINQLKDFDDFLHKNNYEI